MAKKLVDIKKDIDGAGTRFKTYLDNELPTTILDLLEKLSEITEVYIFSGVIRNFFLKKPGFRDLDIVLKNEINVDQFFTGFNIIKNSFGGFKISGENIVIDLWFLDETWAFVNEPPFPYAPKENLIAGTAFFNFSAIIYAFKEQKFYADRKFFRFIQDKKIDLVYEPNANHSLCVVNTLYYEDKFHLKITDRLKKHIISLYKELNSEFHNVQQKHFGDILYTEDEIHNRVLQYSNSLKTRRSKTKKGQLSF